jgi:hypothetical protein
MKHFLLFTVIFLQLQLLAQNFTITEQYHWGTTSLDYLRGVERTSDGGYLLFGQAKVQNNSITDTMYGYEDYFVMKLDNNKNLLWNKTYGGSSSDEAITLLKLLNGNYLLIGTSFSPISGTRTAVNYGGYDCWVVCINESGDVLWDKSFGTIDFDFGSTAINIDQNKTAVLIHSYGGVSGNKTLSSKGGLDGWLVEIDTLGTILNQHVYGGAEEDYFNNIKKLNNGNYLLGCSTRSGVSGDKNSDSFGARDTWLLEVDTNFAIVNQFAFGGVGDEFLRLIEETPTSYLFGGSSSSTVSGNKTSPKRSVYADGILLKTDKNFTILNEKSFGHSSAQEYLIYDQLTFQNNQKVLFGYASGNASPYNSRITHGPTDIWLMQVDENLNQNWNYSFGSSGGDFVVKGFVNSNYELELFGHFDATSSYDISVSTFGGTDILYAKLSSDLSVLESQLAVGVYPNPSRGIFHVTSATPISAYSVFSVDGRLQANGATLTGSLDLQHLPTGTYIAHFVSGKTSSSVKLVIE